MDKKKFLVVSILSFLIAVFVTTMVMTTMKPQLHKSLMFEIINVKFKK